MRRILLISIVLLISGLAKAQDSYLEGYYYNASGQKITGLINIQLYWDKINFKVNKDDKPNKININNISAIVLNSKSFGGTDSLSVLTENNNEKERYFAKFYFATSTTRFFYKFLELHGGGVTSLSSYSNIPNSYNSGTHNINRLSTSPIYTKTEQRIMYQDGQTTYQLSKKNYVDIFSKAFADVPEFVERLHHKEFKFNQMSQIFEQYKHERNQHQNIPVTIKLDSGG